MDLCAGASLDQSISKHKSYSIFHYPKVNIVFDPPALLH